MRLRRLFGGGHPAKPMGKIKWLGTLPVDLINQLKNYYFIESRMVSVLTSTSMRGQVAGLRAAPRKAILTRPRLVTRASAIAGEVPDMNKRNIMNLLLLGAVGAPAVALAGPFAYFFVPKRYGF
jgi:hypothetical protein